MNLKHQSPAPLLLLFAAVLCCSRPMVKPTPTPPRADIIVARDSTGAYRTINDALRAATDGQTVLVMPGVYVEQVRFEGAGRVTLLGLSPATTIIDGTDSYAAVEFRTDSNRISGFTLRNADAHGAWVRDGHQVIDHCLVVDNGDRGIYTSAMAGNASALIDHCTIVDNGETGIYAARDSAGTVITNCIIARNPRGIVTDQTAGAMTIEYNCVRNRSVDFDRVVPGPTNLKQDPGFRDPERSDYALARTSPCRRAASDGSDLGYFPYR